jgi:ABC-type nitrate/sulfonate/bicarbonate transport system ATPase subunit
LLAQVGLIDDLAKYPAELSGGMEQRLNFVMALALDPDVLFLDEPFGSLDTVTRRQLQELLQRIVHVPERKTTMVFVTHDLQEACYMANRVLIMRQSPVTNGTLAEVHVEAALPRSAAILYEAEFVRISQRVHVLMDGAVE